MQFSMDNQQDILTPLIEYEEIISEQNNICDLAPLIYEQIQLAAIGNLSELKKLREKNPNLDVNVPDYDGRTPLHLASEEGHEQIVEYLLSIKDINTNLNDRWSQTPIQCAIKNGRFKIISMLKAQGADEGVKIEVPLHNDEISEKLQSRAQKYQVLFHSIAKDEKAESVPISVIEDFIKKSGFHGKNEVVKKQINEMAEGADFVTWKQFRNMMFGRKVVLQRVFTQKLVINKWKKFCGTIFEIFDKIEKNTSGELPTYTDVLSEESRKESFGVSIVTVDGQSFDYGDTNKPYAIQSCMNPLIYAMTIEDYGYDTVHEYIGKEPSGHKYNSIVLNHANKPHNPCTNAGAMVVCSLFHPENKDSTRIKAAMKKFSELAGDTKINFDNQTYLSEKDASDVNRALSYYLAAKNSFPPNTNFSTVLDYYLQLCSLELDNRQLATIASTFANYGVCPLTGKKVLSTATAIRTNQITFSCGMFDYSGEWACTVGLPGNSGISGNLYIVVPGVCGISIYSPLLNDSANSVRGLEFGKEIVKRFNWNTFDVLESTRRNAPME